MASSAGTPPPPQPPTGGDPQDDDVEVPESPALLDTLNENDEEEDYLEETYDGPEACLQAAQEFCRSKEYGRAVKLLHDGILCEVLDPGMKFKLLLQRSEAFSGMCTWITSQSASRSELLPFYGQEPSYYADLARQDAEAARQLMPSKPEPYVHLGRSLFLLEEYQAAKKAYDKGLAIDPANQEMKDGLDKVAELLATSAVAACGATRAQGRPVTWDTDIECTLCMEMLYEPVTTPCGHSFCQNCFARAMDHNNRCPMCRVVLHVGRKLPVTLALKNILLRSFPNEYETRREDAEKESKIKDDGPLPLFVMSLLLPGERMALNIFEPRYRLMIRRCMEGNRCFAMGRLDPSTGEVLPVACQVEIIEFQAQADGRFGIEIIARRRFNIERTWELDGYRVAQPVYFTDSGVSHGSSESQELQALVTDVDALSDCFLQKVRSVLNQRGHGSSAVRQLLARVGDKPDLAATESFSFWAASLSVFQEEQRTQLLQEKNTLERLGCAKASLSRLCSDTVSPSSCCIM